MAFVSFSFTSLLQNLCRLLLNRGYQFSGRFPPVSGTSILAIFGMVASYRLWSFSSGSACDCAAPRRSELLRFPRGGLLVAQSSSWNSSLCWRVFVVLVQACDITLGGTSRCPTSGGGDSNIGRDIMTLPLADFLRVPTPAPE